jgi:hypothetical protein
MTSRQGLFSWRFGHQAKWTNGQSTLRQGNVATAKDIISVAAIDRQVNYIPWRLEM